MRNKFFHWENLGLAIILLSSLIGELYRFHGFLLLDLVMPFVVGAWIWKKWRTKEPIKLPATVPFALLFVSIGWASLLIHSGEMTSGEFIKAAFYGGRWLLLFILSILVFNQSAQEASLRWKLFGAFTLLLCTAGFIQLHWVPDFSIYENLGWDPHQNRLLSTWFDPNFVGGFLAFILPVFAGKAWEDKRTRSYLIPIFGIGLVALALTLSRSSYLAFLLGMGFFTLLRSFKLAMICGLLLLTIGWAVPPVHDRFLSLVDGISSATQETYTLPDASARLRYASWETGWKLFLDSPWIGQGYNRYKEASLELGLVISTTRHSASGSDSSLLTILATTGIFGFMPFTLLYGMLFLSAWMHRNSTTNLGILSGLLALFAHSIFVNSLLFPLLMAPVWMVLGELPLQTIASKNQAPSSAQ